MDCSQFKCKRTLLQRTPLIHFQYDQRGVVLSVSGVKPMLDRFIEGFVKRHNIAVPADWYIKMPEEKPYTKPFDYKMSIKAEGDTEMVKTHKLYFGGMGNGADKARALMFTGAENKGGNCIKLEILCLHENKALLPSELNGFGLPEHFTLLELIEFVLPAFFALTCFGTRATKGFGSFNVSEEPLSDEYIHLFVPVFYTVDYDCIPNHEDVLNDIWVISGMMKSGFNFGEGSYYKGRSLLYLRNETDKKMGADKAFVKQRVLTNGFDKNYNSEEKKEYAEHRFIRAMLGLPQMYLYRAGPATTRSGKVKIKGSRGNEVKRFASPVRFVPNGKTLYIIPTEIPSAMFGAEFRFNRETIITPSDKEFDLIKFLDWFAASFNSGENFEEFKLNPRSKIVYDVMQRVVTKKTLKITKHSSEGVGESYA